MEIKEFKVPLYKDEKGNKYISTRHINEGINGKEIGEKDFFDTGNIQGEIKKDNIIDLSSYKSSIDDKDEIMPFEEEPTLEDELRLMLLQLKKCIKDGTKIIGVKKNNDRGRAR